MINRASLADGSKPVGQPSHAFITLTNTDSPAADPRVLAVHANFIYWTN